MRRIAISILALGLISQTGFACTTLLLGSKERPIFGRNYDYFFGDGMIVVNKRDMSKTAISLGNPVKWTSNYGSVTFNQYGREFPCGGINEHGLTIAVLWLGNTKYEKVDQRPSINPLQWVQFQLDTAKDLQGVIASEENVRVAPLVGAMLHYFVADRSGSCAVIEFLDGKRKVYTGTHLPAAALANSTYAHSIQNLTECQAFGGSKPAASFRQRRRFINAAARAKTFDASNSNPIDYAFATLDHVSQPRFTRWQIVYDIANQKVHLKTDTARAKKTIDLTKLEFNVESEVKILDINSELDGDISTKLENYSAQKNSALIRSALKQSPLSPQIPRFVIDAVAAYPATTKSVKRLPTAP